jgi:outer membrane protein assembly factor BamB
MIITGGGSDVRGSVSANTQDSYVVALRAATGAVRETLTMSQTGRPYWITPDGTAYLGQNYQLCAMRIANAARLWCAPSLDAESPTNGSILLARTSSRLFYSTIADGGIIGSPVEVGALDNVTGKVLWTWQGPGRLYSGANSMSLVLGQSALYFATTQGLYAFQLSTGHILWHVLPTSDLSFIGPALAG